MLRAASSGPITQETSQLCHVRYCRQINKYKVCAPRCWVVNFLKTNIKSVNHAVQLLTCGAHCRAKLRKEQINPGSHIYAVCSLYRKKKNILNKLLDKTQHHMPACELPEAKTAAALLSAPDWLCSAFVSMFFSCVYLFFQIGGKRVRSGGQPDMSALC